MKKDSKLKLGGDFGCHGHSRSSALSTFGRAPTTFYLLL